MTTQKLNEGDFGSPTLEGETFYFRCRSFVSIKTGQPLSERKLQKIKLADKDTSLYKNLKSSSLHIKAGELREKILKWEAAAQNGSKVSADGTVVVPEVSEVPFVAPGSDITVADFFKNVFIKEKEKLVATGQVAAITLATYRRYWKMFLEKHFNGTKTLKNYTAAQGRHFLLNLTKKDGKTLLGENTLKKIHSTASGIFTAAVEAELVERNVWSDIRRDKAPRLSAEQGAAYTEEQVITMIHNLGKQLGDDARRDSNIQAAQIVLALGFWAGLRPSEIIALQWEADVLVDESQQMIFWNLVFQTEVVEQCLPAGLVPHHDQQASKHRNPAKHASF